MSDLKLSALQRPETLSNLAGNTFDVLIIGGGITGAGVALDAISRGMSVALIEKQDFAWGTSSRSTKLIHGGLRYLKQFEINLVREVGREREIIYQNAPHIVHPDNMLLPIVKDGSLGKYSTSVGLYVYDVLAGVKRSERRVMLGRERTLKQEPLLKKDIVLGGGLYKEYRTDDARLVIEVLKTARHRGVEAANYVQANEFIYESGKATGVQATDLLTGKPLEIKARCIVNAAGPWVDELRQLDNSLNGKRLHLTKGVHIVVPYDKLPLKQAIYFDVADGRMIFAIPRDKITYIGTTDTNYKQQTDKPTATAADVEYLLKATNALFPAVNLTKADIQSSWAGLRPLIHEEGKGPSELSRKDELFISKSGVIAIAGGKLTGFRKMAERTVDEVAEMLSKKTGNEYSECRTHKIVLSGGDFQNLGEIADMKEHVATTLKIDTQDACILVEKYGTNTQKIIQKAAQLSDTYKDRAQLVLAAELLYCLEEEMVVHPSDFLIRRSGMLYFERDEIAPILPLVLSILQEKLQLPAELFERFTKEFETLYEQAVTFE